MGFLINSFIEFPAATESIAGWEEIDRVTLGDNATSMNVSVSNYKYYMLLVDMISNTNNPEVRLRLNSDADANYSFRRGYNDNDDSTSVNRNQIENVASFDNVPNFMVMNWANLASNEKLLTMTGNSAKTTGSATAPDQTSLVAKWANTSSSITSFNFDGATYLAGSEVVALGWNPTGTTDNFWEELADIELGSAGDSLNSGTITAKRYIWVQFYIISSGATNCRMTFNGDTGNNYSLRNSDNGGTSGETTGAANLNLNVAGAGTSFYNAFIVNNTSKEKLIIDHGIGDPTTGSGNPPDRDEKCGKWANTAAQITNITVTNLGTGSYDTGSILKIWGHD
tara:strand:+ start:121 stop:1137 length:1017 start_codon:yes stop_codon:yes gene_type:complete